MTDTEALRGLLAKVKGATGPDRDLDIEIWCALDPSEKKPGKVPLPWLCCYTSSIDAALALVEQVLPGHKVGFQPCIGGTRFRAHLLHITPTSASLVMEALAPTAPLAILGSLLKALVARSEPAALAQGGHHEA